MFLICCLAFALHGQNLPWWKDGVHGSEIEVVRPFLPEDPVILEAGACSGEDTLLLAKNWPKGTIHAFEPYLPYYESLAKKVSEMPQIHAYPFGLYSVAGEYSFHVSQIWKGAASLLEDNRLPGNPYDDVSATIKCKNLDEWAREAQVDHIDYMWLDMEGVELEMLRSAPNIFKTVKAISTEVNFRVFRKGMVQFKEIDSFMEANGMTLYKIWESPPNTRNWQATAIYIRKGL